MRVSLVLDNLASEGLQSEHGLSFLVETDDGSVLFDAGQSDAWLHNLTALGRDPKRIKAMAVSHGHYDHTGGLTKAMGEAPGAQRYAHPACFEPKYARSAGEMRYIGMPPEVVARKDSFALNTSPVEMLPGVTLSGEIPLGTDTVLDGRFVVKGDEFRQDAFEDEQCLVLRSADSTAVLVGCAHRGLENNVLAAMDGVGVERIDLLAGGFHLGGASQDRLQSIAGFLQGMDIGQIVCCHCTGEGAYEYLRSKLGPQVTLARAGMCWHI